MRYLSILCLCVATLLIGCSAKVSDGKPESSTAVVQSGDDEEVWSRCGPIAGAAEHCLRFAREYATGDRASAPACTSLIGSKDDTELNNAWLTLGPNGASRADFEKLRSRRLDRFQAALPSARDPHADLLPVERQLFQDEYTDCWSTYNSLRGLHASPEARDAFIKQILAMPYFNP